MAVGSEKAEYINSIAGVRLAAVESNIRYDNRLDLVLVEITAEASVAGVFTQNAFCAAPVRIAKQHLSKESSLLFLINTGNANAGTGVEGEMAAIASCQALADLNQCRLEQILPFSTGVIGEQFPVSKVIDALPALQNGLDEDNWVLAAKGILTTDTRTKIASRQYNIADSPVKITGFAKGAGMIKPDMATMLGFVFTDAKIAKPLLQHFLLTAVKRSFNRITVDGDTSTNDCCMLVATGKGSLTIDDANSADAKEFQAYLNAVFEQLATGLIRDAEGATKFITIEVTEGASGEECLAVAYTVAESPLVKTACFASDPNWGRILAAIGRAGIKDLDIDSVTVSLGETLLVSNGSVDANYCESVGQAEMNQDEIRVSINLSRGQAAETVWTSDLSNEYVRINADYRS